MERITSLSVDPFHLRRREGQHFARVGFNHLAERLAVRRRQNRAMLEQVVGNRKRFLVVLKGLRPLSQPSEAGATTGSPKRMAAEVERGHRLAERRVGGLEDMIHLGREPRRDVPIVGFGKHMVAALEPNATIAERLVRFDVERGSHVGACGFDRVAHPLSHDARRIGQSVIGAPAFDCERRAVMGEEIGVEALDERKRLEPSDEAVRPGRRLSGRCDG